MMKKSFAPNFTLLCPESRKKRSSGLGRLGLLTSSFSCATKMIIQHASRFSPLHHPCFQRAIRMFALNLLFSFSCMPFRHVNNIPDTISSIAFLLTLPVPEAGPPRHKNGDGLACIAPQSSATKTPDL